MSKVYYVGFRIEVAKRIITMDDIVLTYNKNHSDTQLFDFHKEGRILIKKTKELLLAHGEDVNYPTDVSNFAVMIAINRKKEAERLIKIINVLGNDRLLKERVKTFINGKSTLNNIDELVLLKQALKDLDKIIPGLIRIGFYYAPDAKLK